MCNSPTVARVEGGHPGAIGSEPMDLVWLSFRQKKANRPGGKRAIFRVDMREVFLSRADRKSVV